MSSEAIFSMLVACSGLLAAILIPAWLQRRDSLRNKGG